MDNSSRAQNFTTDSQLGQDSDARFRALVTASSDVLYRMSADWSEMRQLNSAGFLEETTEETTAWFDRYIPAEAHPEVRQAIDVAICKKQAFELEHRVRRADGSVGWTLSRAVPLFDGDGNIAEWFGAASDVTARRRAEEALRNANAEKETLLKEIHHRVKNNLQIVDSLLRLQSDAFPDTRLSEIVNEMANRVHVIAEIHQLLYGSADLAHVDMGRFIERLGESLSAIQSNAKRASLLVRANHVLLNLQHAVPLGLVLNELISNSLKHAFPSNRSGKVEIDLHLDQGVIVAKVSDDGIGFPDPIPSSSLGLQLVRVLAEQLQAELQFDTSNGASVSLRFPYDLP